MNSKALREQRAGIIKIARDLLEKAEKENRSLTDEEEQNYQKAMADVDSLSARIEKIESVEALEARNTQTPEPSQHRPDHRQPEMTDEIRTMELNDETRAMALQGWLGYPVEGFRMTDQHRQAMDVCGYRPGQREVFLRLNGGFGTGRRFLDTEQRAQSAFDLSGGGAFVPTGFVPRVEQALLAFGRMREVVEILRTDDAIPLPWPTGNDTTSVAIEIAENEQDVEGALTVGQKTLNAYKYTSRLILVPYELFQNSAIDLAGYIADRMGERHGRTQNTRMTTGTGSGQPTGWTLDSTLGVTAAAIAAITMDELKDLQGSVDDSYRMLGASWQARRATITAIAKLKDGEGRYLWEASTQVGQPERLLGDPIYANPDMAALGTGNITVGYGYWRAYKFREVAGVRVKRLEERYADYDQVAFVSLMQYDGKLFDAGTNPVKHLVQA